MCVAAILGFIYKYSLNPTSILQGRHCPHLIMFQEGVRSLPVVTQHIVEQYLDSSLPESKHGKVKGTQQKSDWTPCFNVGLHFTARDPYLV